MKKSLSNKAFNKVFSFIADSLTPERISAVIDANPEEGVDVLILGRLSKISIVDWQLFDIIIKQELKRQYWDDCVLDKITKVDVSGVMSFKVQGLYHRDTKTEKQPLSFSLVFSATDNIFDNCVEVEFKD